MRARAIHKNLRRAQQGSVLVIVLWIAFGLVSLALYFANSMNFELRASDNRVSAMAADQAIEGAVRYINYLLTQQTANGSNGVFLTLGDAQCRAVPVGEAHFWLIGRDTNNPVGPGRLCFGLVDEASKLNLNTATVEMLENLPRMTPELAAAIVDWRDEDSEVSAEGGAEDDIYQRLSPAYRCKNAPFESIDELRLVYGMDLTTLYGEDSNLNGVLDPNENDGDQSPPHDDSNGKLDPGILEYVTLWSRESNSGRTNVNDPQNLALLLEEMLSTDRANQILARFPSGGGRGGGQTGGGSQGGGQSGQSGQSGQGGQGGGGVAAVGSVLEFYLQSGMTEEEFAQIADYITATNSDTYSEGLININTASEAVLGCLPGIGTNDASAVVAYRESNSGNLGSVAWLVNAVGNEAARQAGPYVTTHSYQVGADIAAVGHHGRGYQRMKYIFDTSEGELKILYRQDLTHLGWALGRDARNNLLLTENTR
jgi:type II secretory pathway component PulK